MVWTICRGPNSGRWISTGTGFAGSGGEALMAERSPADAEISVSDCFSSLPSSWTIDVARRHTPAPGTAPGSERILASRFERYSGSCSASEDISCTTTALNPIIARNAINTVNVTAVTLPICHRRSQRTAGASRKLSRIARAIGTMTSRAKYKNATTNPTVSRISTPEKPEGIWERPWP